jgi:hypothetical protein
MVVFTSGIVDARLAACLSGFEFLLPSVGWGWGQAHCWVLKNQPRVSAFGGGVVGAFGPPFAACSLCAGVCCLLVVGVGGGCVVLVGLLFEICIVDASIFATRTFSGCEI